MTRFRWRVSNLISISDKQCVRSKVSARKASSGTTCSRTYHDIPTKNRVLPASWDLLRSGGPGYLHEHCDRLHAELGPIFRERLGSAELVFIADTKMIQAVVANEGTCPHHNVPEAWTLYNQMKGIERGLFFQAGEPWVRLRRAFNKVMLADSSKISRFARDILKINSNLFDCWQQSKSDAVSDLAQHESIVIDDVKFELCKWSIEATGLMLFGRRMGCIAAHAGDPNDRDAEELVQHVANMFAETSNFQVIPCKLAQRFNLATWRRFEAASNGMIRLATDYASEFIERAKDSREDQSLVRDFLDLNSLNEEEILRSVVDLIIAAADTTSNSLQWMLYILAKQPEVQATIHKEVRSLDLEELEDIKQSCPYLSAFIKEVSRLYPTAPFLARTLDQAIALDNYQVPAQTPIVFSLYTTSRMESYFEDPLSFKPERWLRNEQKSLSKAKTSSHAYASLPFGIGARMCIGRRLADLEMHLLLASFVRRYEARLTDQNDNTKIKLKMILCPDKPIKLRLTLRN